MDLYGDIEDFLSQYRENSRATYRSFLRAFLPLISEDLEAWSDVNVIAAGERFDAYCKEKDFRPSTVRSHRYALRSFLLFQGVQMSAYDLASPGWENSTRIIFEDVYDCFIEAGKALFPNIKEEFQLICDLAYYGGLTTNEILHLNASDFYKYDGKAYRVNVTAVSRQDKERAVELPQCMQENLEFVLSSDPHPLFTLGKKHAKTGSYESDKWYLRQLISKVRDVVNEGEKELVRYDLKAFRTSRILLDLYSGRERKSIMYDYGITTDYISRLLAEERS